MMELDKKIREGLVRQAAAPAASHPDPDLLTAFVEQALSQPERQQVLQHLSLCTDCREVVALSLPEVDAAPVAVSRPETSIWHRWLVVRWAAAAAAVVVVAGAVTLYQTNQPRQMAKIVDGPAAIADMQARQAKPASPVATSHAAVSQAEVPPTETTTAAKKSVESKPSEPAVVAGAVPQDRVASVAKAKAPAERADQIARNVSQPIPAPVAAPPVNSVAAMQSPNLKTPADVAVLERPVQVQGGTYAGAGANAAFPSGDGHALRPSGDQPVQTYDQGDATFTVADAGTRRNGVTFGRGAEAKTLARREPLGVGMFSTAPAPMPNAPMLAHGWSVTTDGLLKRSHGINDSHTVRVADGVFFKAVAETGSEVWAGGIGGALYHSVDDGRNWMKVMPSAGEQPLIADIVSIHATQRGAAELSTSNGERWMTVDGGQHWTRHQ